MRPKEHDTLSMVVNEQVEESKAEELEAGDSSPDPAPEGASEETSRSYAPNWLPLAYSIEFLIALMAIITVWSEIGGQDPLDLMPWYTKLACVVAGAWCTVRFTAGMVEEKKVWNHRTVAWFAAIVLLAIAMAGITYYYHLQQNELNQPDTDDTTTAAMNTSFPTVLADVHDRITL
jgi:hypothetical protein